MEVNNTESNRIAKLSLGIVIGLLLIETVSAAIGTEILLGTNRFSVWAPYYGPELVNYEPDETSFKFYAGALVMDEDGKPLPGESVTFYVYSGDNTLKATITSTTNANGIAYMGYNTKGDFTASGDSDYGTWGVAAILTGNADVNATRNLQIDEQGYLASGCSKSLCHNSPDEADQDYGPLSPYSDKFGSSTNVFAADAHITSYHSGKSCETCHSGYGKSSSAPATSYPWGTHTNIACTDSGCHGSSVFSSFPPNIPSCYDCHPNNNDNQSAIDTTATVNGVAGATVYSWNHELKSPLMAHTTDKTYNMSKGIPCWVCHGPMHNITKPDPAASNTNSYTEDSQCKTCHSSKTEHNNQVKCTVCHSQNAHNINFFDTAGNYVKDKTNAGDCTTCHQQTAAWNTLLTQPGAGSYAGSGSPQIPAPLNHSDNATGQRWGNYWTLGNDLSACNYCHGDTKHSAVALGRPASWKGINTVNSPLNTANNWCAGCHYQGYTSGSDSYNDMISEFTGDGLSVPPENTGNPTYAPSGTPGYFNHSLGDYSDESCSSCHGDLATSATNISALMHNVASASTTPPETDHNISLISGWNLISIPLERSNWSLTSVLAPIEGKYTVVFAYIGGGWKRSTAPRSALTDMSLEYGYWINMTESATLQLSGTTPPATTMNVDTGWNLVGYPSLTAQNLTTVLSPISYTVVFEYDGGWKRSTAPRSALTHMSPGYGYWVNATDTGSYEV